jgi:hypothetical protein
MSQCCVSAAVTTVPFLMTRSKSGIDGAPGLAVRRRL